MASGQSIPQRRTSASSESRPSKQTLYADLMGPNGTMGRYGASYALVTCVESDSTEPNYAMTATMREKSDAIPKLKEILISLRASSVEIRLLITDGGDFHGASADKLYAEFKIEHRVRVPELHASPAETVIKQLYSIMRPAMLHAPKNAWEDCLIWATAALNIRVPHRYKISPHYALFGTYPDTSAMAGFYDHIVVLDNDKPAGTRFGPEGLMARYLHPEERAGNGAIRALVAGNLRTVGTWKWIGPSYATLDPVTGRVIQAMATRPETDVHFNEPRPLKSATPQSIPTKLCIGPPPGAGGGAVILAPALFAPRHLGEL